MLQTPRASQPVALPLPGISHGMFTVRALTPLEDAETIDRAWASPEGERIGRLEEGLICACLYEGDRRAFDGGLQLADLLDELEFARVRAVVLPALYCVSPSYRRSDAAAWFAQLCIGAAHWSNQQLAVPLAQCVDSGYRGTWPRPERYFGGTVADLTDGQWMAFRAAYQVIVKAREHG